MFDLLHRVHKAEEITNDANLKWVKMSLYPWTLIVRLNIYIFDRAVELSTLALQKIM